MKKVIIVLIVITLIAGAWYFLKGYTRKPPATTIELSGTIETTEVDVSFQVPGKIVKLVPQEGDQVKKGELIAQLDDRDLTQSINIARSTQKTIHAQLPQLETKIDTSKVQEARQLVQAKAQIDEAKLRWESLRKGSRTQEIKRAKFNVSQARHMVENNKREYDRAEGLYKDGAAPAQQRDLARTNYLTSVDLFRQAEESHKLALEGPRQEDIDAAASKIAQAEAAYDVIKTQSLQTRQLEQQREIFQAQIDQAEANITQARIQQSHTKLFSPITGVVLLRPKEPGEVVSAGTTVLTMANIEKVYLKAYIGETDLGKIKLGDKVAITTDSFPGKKYEGTIYFISSEAEFTPKNLTTKEDRVKLVYRIKVEVPNPKQELKPGMIADGIIDLQGR